MTPLSSSVPPHVKRQRIAESQECVRRQDLRGNEYIQSILRIGVFRFLSVEDAATVLRTCRLLRTDAQFVDFGVRALPEFSSDFRVFHDTITLHPKTPLSLHDHWVNDLGDSESEKPAQILAAAAFLKTRIFRWCFAYDSPHCDEDDDVLCSVRPVIIPLAQLYEGDAGGASSPRWSRQEITVALNNLCGGGGDAFFDKKSAAESRFAAHWDSIYIDRVSGRISCRLCDAARDAIVLYKRQVDTALRQYALVLRMKQDQWKKSEQLTSEELESLTKELHAKHFPATAYVRPECLEWPERQLLRHICDHGNFQAWQIGDAKARGISTVDALLRAVSLKYQHQCRTFYQPLKKSLHNQCHVIGRIPHATIQRLRVPPTKANGEPVNSSEVLMELVGGVECTSGIFSGVQVTFQLLP